MEEMNYEAMATQELEKSYADMAKNNPELPAAVIWASLAVSAMALALELKAQSQQPSGNQTPLVM